MLELDRANIENINFSNYKIIVLKSNFLSIYGLPFCILYTKKIQNAYSLTSIALEVNNLQGTATLAIINNFPNLIVDSILLKELLIIKENSKSITNLFSSLQNFKEFVLSDIALNE